MRRMLALLAVGAALLLGGIYGLNHHPQSPPAPAAQSQVAPAQPQEEVQPSEMEQMPEAKQAHSLVTIAGPLYDYVAQQQKPSQSQSETPQRSVAYKPSAEDHIEDSPVGTSTRVVHKIFPVARAVNVPFEIPPHAATPHFHGTFRSFAQGNAPSNGEGANVDMMLMTEDQFAEFVAGHDPDVVFIADASHYQDINLDLSPSRDQPVKYHLVFRNAPGGASKKLVQADFAVDF